MTPHLLWRYACALTTAHEKKLPTKHEKVKVDTGVAVICNAKDLAEIDPYFPRENGKVALQPFGESNFRAFWIDNGIPKSQIWEPIDGYFACYFNCPRSFDSAAVANGGALIDNGYHFEHAASAVEVIKTLGTNIDLPSELENRPATIRQAKSQPNKPPKIKLEIRRESMDGDFPGLPTDRSKKQPP